MPRSSGDSRLWQGSCLSKAPTRDLMRMFRPQSQVREDVAWIWKLPILPRAQLFLWKLLWDCLPTCLSLSRRGMSIQPFCPICRRVEESSDHAIFLCYRARQIWHLIGYTRGQDGGGSSRSMFFQDIRRGPQQKKILWAITAYQIWLSRNQLTFSNDPISTYQTVRKIRSLSAECAQFSRGDAFDSSGLWGSPAASAANRHTVFISWEPPPPGVIKINFDGSVRGRAAGSAFIIRGHTGDLRAAGGFGSIDFSVPMAELYAAWAGISFAVRTLHAARIIVEGDSMTVISWMKNEHSGIGTANPVLREIWSMLREVGSVQIRHIFREANSAADWMASFVAQYSGPWVWSPDSHCPSLLQQILLSDVSGLIRTRQV